MRLPPLALEQLEMADLRALRRFARFLRLGVPAGEGPEAKRKIAARIARALRHGARGAL